MSYGVMELPLMPNWKIFSSNTYGLETVNCRKCVKFFVDLAKDAGISIIKMKRIARYTGRQV